MYERYEVVAKVIQVGLVPIFYHVDVEIDKEVCLAVVEAGSELLEFSNRGARAYKVFAELVKLRDSEKPNLILGAGTILDPA